LILDDDALKYMARHGAEGYPEEVCGLLVGSREAGGSARRIVQVERAANQARDRSSRYELDPRDQIKIEDAARRRNLELVGVYHSHPDRPALPSATDRERARELWMSSDSWSYVILEVSAGGAVSWKSWVLQQGSFVEEPMEISASRRPFPREREPE
jgi:proteasome lid subunit RPN8/RPN11